MSHEYGYPHLFTGSPPERAPEEWADLREAEARNLGITASNIRAGISGLLHSVGTSRVDRGAKGDATPVVVPGPPAKDILDLARAAGALVDTAERLMSAGPPPTGRRRIR